MKRLIIGCGYLGIEVARGWLQQGDQVFSLTRDADQFRQRWNQQLDQKIDLIRGDIVLPSTLPQLPLVDTVLFAVGMDRSRYSDIYQVYVQGLENILVRLSPQVRHFIYISSTGVYGANGGNSNDASPQIDENSPAVPSREGGRACLAAEEMLRQFFKTKPLGADLSILRFAGIYGPQRVPFKAKVEAGQWSQLSPEGYLNLIHVLDGARIVQHISNNPPRSDDPEMFIVSDGNPVLRKDFYEEVARLLQTGPIQWDSLEADGNVSTKISNKVRGDKKLVNDRIRERLKNFEFEFPDYRHGLEHSLVSFNRTPE